MLDRVALATIIFAGTACDPEGLDGMPTGEDIAHRDRLTTDDLLESDAPHEIIEAQDDPSCEPDETFYDPEPGDLQRADVLTALPPEVLETLESEGWNAAPPTTPSTLECDWGGAFPLGCSNQSYGCASCFQDGQPRRRVNQYSKICTCTNGSFVCGPCYYTGSYCPSC